VEFTRRARWEDTNVEENDGSPYQEAGGCVKQHVDKETLRSCQPQLVHGGGIGYRELTLISSVMCSGSTSQTSLPNPQLTAVSGISLVGGVTFSGQLTVNGKSSESNATSLCHSSVPFGFQRCLAGVPLRKG